MKTPEIPPFEHGSGQIFLRLEIVWTVVEEVIVKYFTPFHTMLHNIAQYHTHPRIYVYTESHSAAGPHVFRCFYTVNHTFHPVNATLSVSRVHTRYVYVYTTI